MLFGMCAGASGRGLANVSRLDFGFRLDTLSTLKPNGMLSRRQNAISSLALARHLSQGSASVSVA
jgi:hypothetical protein